MCKCSCETPKADEPRPFDLEAAKRGEPVQTRGGEKIEFLAHHANTRLDNCVLFKTKTGWLTTTVDGKFCGTTSEQDVFMAPKPKASVTETLYLVQYPNGSVYMTKNSQSWRKDLKTLGYKRVTITEGEFAE